jgi:hypothetical protein
MPYPAENLTERSSQAEIQQAIEATVAQLTSEGLPEDEARQRAVQMARQGAQGLDTKLVRSNRVGALRDSGLAGSNQTDPTVGRFGV